MFIYNVTSKIHFSIADDWLQWMQQVHIPDVMSTGCFEDYQLVKLLDLDDSDGPTYAVQYYATSLEHYQQYIDQHAPSMREAGFSKWGDKFIAFRSIMQVVK